MNKSEKILVIIFFSALFLISGLNTSSAITPEKNIINKISEKPLLTAPLTKTVTIYRYGIYGEIKPIEIAIKFKEGQEINDAISEKCEELLLEDVEFQSLKNNNTSTGVLSFVHSKGRGLHIKPLPRFRFIFCRYPRDPIAYTKISPLFGGNATTINGPHQVISFGFIGFKWWLDRISILGFFFRTGYIGFSLFTKVIKF